MALHSHQTSKLCVQIKEGLPARLEQDPEAEEVSLLTGQAYGDAAVVNDDQQEPLELGLRKVSPYPA